MLTIGIDDTDSERGFCTTYLAAVLIDRLKEIGEIAGLPKLVRLNPCARFKTRGNASIAIPLETTRVDQAKKIALQTLLELSDLSGVNTNPGLVIAEHVSPKMHEFYRQAVTKILKIEEAKSILESEGIWHRGFKLERGLIGALAAVGAEFPDHTYELITYRKRELWGTKREIDLNTVWKADELTYPRTWDTVDYSNKRIVFTPHSPDPVLYGIRGDDPEALKIARDVIASEVPERTVLYMTNQGTDAHILNRDLNLQEDQSYRIKGLVEDAPSDIKGGHVFFTIKTAMGLLECAAFEPTKGFRDIVRKLVPGDVIEAYGAIRDEALNLEKIEVLKLKDIVIKEAPVCKECGKRMSSAGHNQGYRCRRCKTKTSEPRLKLVKREIETGFYEVPPSARRHLAKPLIRMKGNVHPSR